MDSTQDTQVTKEYNVTPVNPVNWVPDLTPSLIPALQSSSYVLVILVSFLAWSSRKLAATFLERHLELMHSISESLKQEKQNNDKQIATLESLAENNKTLANALDKAITVSSK